MSPPVTAAGGPPDRRPRPRHAGHLPTAHPHAPHATRGEDLLEAVDVHPSAAQEKGLEEASEVVHALAAQHTDPGSWRDQVTARSLVFGTVLGVIFSIITQKLNLTAGIIPSLGMARSERTSGGGGGGGGARAGGWAAAGSARPGPPRQPTSEPLSPFPTASFQAATLLGFFTVNGWSATLVRLGYIKKPFTPPENTVMQTCISACAGAAFAGGFGSFLIAMDEQSYLNVGVGAPGNRPEDVYNPTLARTVPYMFCISFVGIFMLVQLRKRCEGPGGGKGRQGGVHAVPAPRPPARTPSPSPPPIPGLGPSSAS